MSDETKWTAIALNHGPEATHFAEYLRRQGIEALVVARLQFFDIVVPAKSAVRALELLHRIPSQTIADASLTP